jgi:hypothetical protein
MSQGNCQHDHQRQLPSRHSILSFTDQFYRPKLGTVHEDCHINHHHVETHDPAPNCWGPHGPKLLGTSWRYKASLWKNLMRKSGCNRFSILNRAIFLHTQIDGYRNKLFKLEFVWRSHIVATKSTSNYRLSHIKTVLQMYLGHFSHRMA